MKQTSTDKKGARLIGPAACRRARARKGLEASHIRSTASAHGAPWAGQGLKVSRWLPTRPEEAKELPSGMAAWLLFVLANHYAILLPRDKAFDVDLLLCPSARRRWPTMK